MGQRARATPSEPGCGKEAKSQNLENGQLGKGVGRMGRAGRQAGRVRSKLGVKEGSIEGTGLAGGTEQESATDDKDGKHGGHGLGQVSAVPQ